MVVTCAEISASSAALGGEAVAPKGLGRRGYVVGFRKFPYPQHNIGDEFYTGHRIEFVNECRLEERELVHPDTVVDQEIELLIANVVGPGIRCDGLPDDGDPVPT